MKKKKKEEFKTNKTICFLQSMPSIKGKLLIYKSSPGLISVY